MIGAVILHHFSDSRGSIQSKGQEAATAAGRRGGGVRSRVRSLLVKLPSVAAWTTLGLTPYLYLPWAASKGAETSWGGRDVATFAGFLRSTSVLWQSTL